MGLLRARWQHRAMTRMHLLLLPLLVACALDARAQSCPIPAAAPGTLLTVVGVDGSRTDFDAARLAALAPQQREQRRTVGGAASAPGVEQSVRWSGVLLRDVLETAIAPTLKSREARRVVFEAVATDRYVAVFSWGELFNGAVGDQVLVITAQDERALGPDAGPLALRSLADLRPGPRHVRNLCAVVVRYPAPP
jgi:hypothetical protein